jgi:hypothetical protein
MMRSLEDSVRLGLLKNLLGRLGQVRDCALYPVFTTNPCHQMGESRLEVYARLLRIKLGFSEVELQDASSQTTFKKTSRRAGVQCV